MKKIFGAMLAPLMVLKVGFCAEIDQATPSSVPESQTQIHLSFAPVAKKATPAVVNIYTAKRIRAADELSPLLSDPFFRQFFGDAFGLPIPKDRIQRTLGSGVLVRSDGLVITNHHVIKGADEIRVVLSDRREFEAKVVIRDEKTDLAALKLTPSPSQLPYLELGDSERLEVGDLVLAIGNPLGVGQTVTSGIVSALARTQVGVANFRSFIQTDAPINQGNSGGALVTMDGKLIGINTAIYSTHPQGGSIGIGFAIPVSMVAQVMYALDHGGKVVRPWVGVQVEPVTSVIAEAMHMEKPMGAFVSSVYPGGPADQAGMRQGDVITHVAGQLIQDDDHYRFRIAVQNIGGHAVHRLLREGKSLEISIPLQAPDSGSSLKPLMLTGGHPLAGASVKDVSPDLIEAYALPFVKEGAVVCEIKPRSLAQQWGFAPGDMVLSINGQRVRSASHLQKLLGQNGPWRIHLARERQNLILEAQ